MTAHAAMPVVDASHVSAARTGARRAAERLGFDETQAHRVGLVATELASNLVKHAGAGGVLLVRASTEPSPHVELLAIDRGPGIADVTRSLTDGHSTAGSAGTGLGAVQRLADEFDIYSARGKGTVVLARLRRDRQAAAAPYWQVAGISVAMPGETECGDDWVALFDRGRAVILVVDGLGHGPHAAVAAQSATATVLAGPFAGTVESLHALHAALRSTRGAAATVVSLEPRATVAVVAGVGNVSTTIVGPEASRHAVSLSGILGHDVRQFREYQYPWPPGALLVMHSDGLISHWSLDGYPGLRQRHPALVAAVLYRDFQRGRDDVTVVVGREAA